MSLEVPRGRPGKEAASTDPTEASVTQPGRRLHLDLDHFRARILQDALTEATAQYWVHRAHQFQQAAPRLDEYRGQATSEQLTERWIECMATMQACLSHADLIRQESPESITDEVWAVLGEVA